MSLISLHCGQMWLVHFWGASRPLQKDFGKSGRGARFDHVIPIQDGRGLKQEVSLLIWKKSVVQMLYGPHNVETCGISRGFCWAPSPKLYPVSS